MAIVESEWALNMLVLSPMKVTFAFAIAIASALPAAAQLNPSTMPKVGTVDLRFQSYNVEMVEVIGGRF